MYFALIEQKCISFKFNFKLLYNVVRGLDFRVEGLASIFGWVVEIVPLDKVLCTYVSLFTQEYKWGQTVFGEVNL